MHGCKEGQCGSCKSRLISGDIELLKYSTFALPDYERETEHILLCRTHAYSDIEVELLNFDEDLLSRAIPVKEYEARLTKVTPLTHDIRLLEVDLDKPLKFWAGQYVDLTIVEAGVTRAFSMANAPAEGAHLSFIIKKYPAGAFSAQLDGDLRPGALLKAKGPYGTCFRREARTGPMLLIGGGSGMSPLWSILSDHVRQRRAAGDSLLLRRADAGGFVHARRNRRRCGEIAGLQIHSGFVGCRGGRRLEWGGRFRS